MVNGASQSNQICAIVFVCAGTGTGTASGGGAPRGNVPGSVLGAVLGAGEERGAGTITAARAPAAVVAGTARPRMRKRGDLVVVVVVVVVDSPVVDSPVVDVVDRPVVAAVVVGVAPEPLALNQCSHEDRLCLIVVPLAPVTEREKARPTLHHCMGYRFEPTEYRL